MLPRWLRMARLAWRRSQRRRRRSCVRCGAVAAGLCPACGARVCADCSVLSIETGMAVAICRSCTGDGTVSPRLTRRRVPAWRLFRSGAVLLLFALVVLCGLALQSDGWPGVWQVLLTVVHPSVLFALVPLAVVLGAVVGLVRRLLADRIGE